MDSEGINSVLLMKQYKNTANFILFFFFRSIPEDQRILDPRMGPIKKTAAVKTLPHLG